MRAAIMAIALVLAALCGALAQEPPAAIPLLTDVERLQLQAVFQQMEIAQLKAQVVQAEFDKAKAAANALMHSLQKPGYALDVQRLVYVLTPLPKPVPIPPATKPKGDVTTKE